MRPGVKSFVSVVYFSSDIPRFVATARSVALIGWWIAYRVRGAVG